MTGQQLKNSILQEAFQGRLVPNVLQPGEKTGAELLQDILAEHQKKENEEKGKKAKKLNLSTIEEEPWELPEGWCWCRVLDLCELSDATKVSGDFVNMDAAFLRGKNSGTIIKSGRFIKAGSRMILVDGENSGEVFIAPCNGYLGSTFKELYIYLQDSADYLLQFLLYNKDMFRNNKKGAAIPHLNKEIFRTLEIPLPPLSIQKAIVAKIEELFPLVDEYDKAAGELKVLNELLPDKLRKSVLQEAIHGTLVPNDIPEGEATAQELLQQILKERQNRENKEKGKKAKKLTLSTVEEEPWELPEWWCWCSLGDIGSWGAGATPQRGNAAFYQEGTIPWLKTGELNNGVVYDTEEKITKLALEKCSLRLCQPNDVLIAMYGATIGKLAIAGVPLTTNQACCACTPHIGIYNKYIFYFLLAKKDDFTKQAFGGAQPNISKEKIVSTNFPLPPLSIQHRIVEKIEELFTAINQL